MTNEMVCFLIESVRTKLTTLSLEENVKQFSNILLDPFEAPTTNQTKKKRKRVQFECDLEKPALKKIKTI